MDLAFQMRHLMIGEHFNGLRTMKKIYMIVAALSVVFAAVSCNKEDVTVGSSEPIVVRFTAQAADVKAQFNPTSYENDAAVPVLWDGGENLSIAVGDKDAKDFARNCAKVVASDDKRSATWEYDFSGLVTNDYAPKASFTFHAFCGSVRAYRNGRVSRVLLNNIPSEQTPGENSCDPKAIYLYSKSAEYQAWPSEVEMNPFEHLTAYGCITLGTGIPEDETIQSLTITADASTHLSGGAWYYYATGDKYADYTGEDAQTPQPSSSITLKPAEGGVLPRTNLWFGCRPTTKLASLRFTVTTDKGVYEVVKSELDGRNFQAGKVAKMKINDFGAEINEVTYEFTANDLNGFIGGIYGGETLSKTAVSGAYPLLNWSSVATLIEGEESIKAAAVTANDVTRVKFNAGFDNFVFTITPEEGWIVESFNLNSKGANEVYNLHATIGGEDLANALNKSVGTSDTDYKRDNTNNVAGPLSFTYTRKPGEGSTGNGVFYIKSLKVVLKKQELQQEETPETPEE